MYPVTYLVTDNVGIFMAVSVYRDHGWGVWDRLRTTPANAASLRALGAAGFMPVAAEVLFPRSCA